MPIVVEEKFDSRIIVAGDNPSAELRYVVFGTNDEQSALSSISSSAPATYDLMPRRTIQVEPLANELTLVGEVRGRGLMIGLELVEDADKTPAVDAAKEVKKRCREAGILIGVGGSFANVVRLQPPLVLSEDEAVQIVDVLSKVLRDVDGTL